MPTRPMFPSFIPSLFAPAGAFGPAALVNDEHAVNFPLPRRRGACDKDCGQLKTRANEQVWDKFTITDRA